jgi:hypothetical protein
MRSVVKWFSRMRNRAYIYNVLLGATPVILSYGIVTETEWAGWVGLSSAVLGLGVARSNVSTKE